MCSILLFFLQSGISAWPHYGTIIRCDCRLMMAIEIHCTSKRGSKLGRSPKDPLEEWTNTQISPNPKVGGLQWFSTFMMIPAYYQHGVCIFLSVDVHSNVLTTQGWAWDCPGIRHGTFNLIHHAVYRLCGYFQLLHLRCGRAG